MMSKKVTMSDLVLAISLLVLVGCKENKKLDTLLKTEDTVEQTVKTKKAQHSEESSPLYSNSWASEIRLNNDAKWLANQETNEGVEKMLNTVQTEVTKSLADYHKLAEKLNDDKNYVVKNCSMKGASHDNLHIWLMPLITKIKALSETTTVEKASKIKHSIAENINGYYDYFK